MNEQKKISDWLNSGEYLSDLNELRTSIMRDCSISNSESTTATIFEKELYHLVRTKTGIKLDFIKEKSVNGKMAASRAVMEGKKIAKEIIGAK